MIFLRNFDVPIRFGLVPFDERRDLGGLMPPANESFRRLKEHAVIESDMKRIHGELGSLGPRIEKTSFQLAKLNKDRPNYEMQQRDAQEAFKEYQQQIVKVQKATDLVAGKKAGTPGPDQPGESESTDKMRAFLV